MTATAGIDVERITDWLSQRVAIAAPLQFKLIAGGRSNMTFTVTDAAGQRFVLRRPPMGKLLPSAHDMAREHRLMASLAGTAVPVPRWSACAKTRASTDVIFMSCATSMVWWCAMWTSAAA